MPNAGDIRREVEAESARRRRLAVPAFAGGFLYLLSAIVISTTLRGAPTVGLVQGLTPALEGEANPAVSPRTPEVKFISHHAFALIAGGTLAAIAVGVLTLVLLLLADATIFRRPESFSPMKPLIIGGGIGVAAVTLAHQVISAVETHRFAVGSDHSNTAVEHALTTGTATALVDYLALIAGLVLAVGMIGLMINALRVGLLVRWMAFLGMFTGLLIVLPIGGAELQVVPAFWMVMMGILYAGKWPNGEPPAWAAGEARPWPSRAQAPRGGGAGQPATAAAGANGGSSAAPAPAPAPAGTGGSSRKRRRKRGPGPRQ
ncbi:MAG TPA: hypothetical protein VLZ06_07735 [Solirubrobacteraceae bacterium]|nr:hypothetical protein [Solirubrobacteraceae bacterium]